MTVHYLRLFTAVFVSVVFAHSKSEHRSSFFENRNRLGLSPEYDPFRGIPGRGVLKGSLFELATYFGNCPIESRKVVRRLSSHYTCRNGGNFECDNACETRFNDDDEEVLGGRCLNPGGHHYGQGYGTNGGYTGYGGVCVCFYCKGMGVSDTKCMEDTVDNTLDDQEFGQPLCNVQSNSFHETDDDDIFRSAKRSYFSIGIEPRLHDVATREHPISSKRCNDKCMWKYINAEKGICKRSRSYDYVCVCKTCGDAAEFLRTLDNPGTVECSDINPNLASHVVEVFLPVSRPVSTSLCPAPIFVRDPVRYGTHFTTPACMKACLKLFMHHPVHGSECREDPRYNSVDNFDHRCICEICTFPPCLYDTWNDWSYCSTRCNGGTRRRKRNLITGDRTDCTNVIEYRSCNEYPCPIDCVVGPWEQWSTCYGYCGLGFQTRERQMLVPPMYGGKCYVQQFVQRRSCDTRHPCAPPHEGYEEILNSIQNLEGQ